MKIPIWSLTLLLLPSTLFPQVQGQQGKVATLQDDYQALQTGQGFWGKFDGKTDLMLQFNGKQFPVLELTVTERDQDKKKEPISQNNGTIDFAGTFKVSCELRERDGQRSLVIDGKNVVFSFEPPGFLVLKGAIEYRQKSIDLTGKWGKAIPEDKKITQAR